MPRDPITVRDEHMTAAMKNTAKGARQVTRGLSGLALAAMATLTACVSQPRLEAMTPITLLYESQNCGVLEPGMVVLKTTDSWDSLKTRLHRANPLSPAPAIPPTPEGEVALLVAWGQKPNGSYAMELTSTMAAVDGGTLILPVNFREPAPGTFSTQALVSPCLVVGVPENGTFTRVTAGELSVEL